MVPMLFCAAVILSTIFNNVEAGCKPTRHAVEEGQSRAQRPDLDWLFNLELQADDTNNVFCPATGIKPQPDDPYIRAVTTAECAKNMRGQGTRRAKIGDDVIVFPRTNVIVHEDYRTRLEEDGPRAMPEFDIAVVLFPRHQFPKSISTDDWPQIPLTNALVPVPHQAGYSRAFWRLRSTTGQYAQVEELVSVGDSGNCHNIEHSDALLTSAWANGALVCVNSIGTAASGGPVYQCRGQGNPTLIALHQSTITDGYHQSINISPFTQWIQTRTPQRVQRHNRNPQTT